MCPTSREPVDSQVRVLTVDSWTKPTEGWPTGKSAGEFRGWNAGLPSLGDRMAV